MLQKKMLKLKQMEENNDRERRQLEWDIETQEKNLVVQEKNLNLQRDFIQKIKVKEVKDKKKKNLEQTNKMDFQVEMLK